MNIVYAGNKNVFDGLLISLLSLIEVNQQALRVYVLTMDLQELDQGLYRDSSIRSHLYRKSIKACQSG